jgi:RIO-like serine/threonine protein kinase
MNFITQIRRFIVHVELSSANLRNQSNTQAIVHRTILNKLDTVFKGSFVPGKLHQREIQLLNEAECEIKDWNQALLKAKKVAAKNEE